MSNDRYEYKFIDREDTGGHMMWLAYLNNIGQLGWQMCGVSSSFFYFKRKL